MKNGAYNAFVWDRFLREALKEDITHEDISTLSVLPEPVQAKVDLICKEDGILSGLCVFARIFELLDPNVCIETTYADGDTITSSDVIAVLTGDGRALLSGERTALNFLQKMSGISTRTRAMVDLLDGSIIRLVDTRKTTPNLRTFEKYAVRIGGGYNHRYNLSDGVLLKDNHILAAGGVRQAVERARAYVPLTHKIEVETENLAMVKAALAAGADIIMLDNMSDDMINEAIDLIGGKAKIEVSGNIDEARLIGLKKLKIDYISVGALTHGTPSLDFSMKHFLLL